jgi:hypothetical protein
MPDDDRPQQEARPDALRHDDVQLSIRAIADRLNGRSNGDHADDPQPSIAAILASLDSRSEAERHALAYALLDGRNQAPPAPHGASSDSYTIDIQQFSPSTGANCSPMASLKTSRSNDLSHCDNSIISRPRCSPKVSPNRDRGLWLRGSAANRCEAGWRKNHHGLSANVLHSIPSYRTREMDWNSAAGEWPRP